jgi:hypothetical protein
LQVCELLGAGVAQPWVASEHVTVRVRVFPLPHDPEQAPHGKTRYGAIALADDTALRKAQHSAMVHSELAHVTEPVFFWKPLGHRAFAHVAGEAQHVASVHPVVAHGVSLAPGFRTWPAVAHVCALHAVFVSQHCVAVHAVPSHLRVA